MNASKATRPRPTGRRQGESSTRDAILKAAEQHFAAHGYGGTSIRTVAAHAGVDPALIRHFFGSKDKLFSEVLSLPQDAYMAVDAALNSEAEGRAERFLDTYLHLWEDPRTAAPLHTMLRSAMHTDQAAKRFEQFLLARIQSAPVFPDGWATARLLVASQLMGLALTRYILKIEPLASMPSQVLIKQFAPMLEAQFNTLALANFSEVPE